MGVPTAGDCGTDGVVDVAHGTVDADGVDADCGVADVVVIVVGVIVVETVGGYCLIDCVHGVVSAGLVPDKDSLTFERGHDSRCVLTGCGRKRT